MVIIGRTNVGKSTLFNRLSEQSKAITSDLPGTTRDRLEARVLWRGKEFRLIDTGGLDLNRQSDLERQVFKQIELATAEADCFLFVVDGRSSGLPQDQEAARYLRRLRKPVILTLNKLDRAASHYQALAEFQKLGFASSIPVSAKNGSGTGDLLDLIDRILFRDETASSFPEADLRVAIIGRPNVGKSSLFNALVGSERAIVTPIPYTTREPNDTLVIHHGKKYCLIDTAGLRKPSKIARAYQKTKTLEKQSEQKTLATIRRADVCLLVLDLTEPLVQQDRRLIERVLEAEKGLILIANKVDLLPPELQKNQREIKAVMDELLPFLTWAASLAVSAKTKAGLQRVFPLIDRVAEARRRWVDPEILKEYTRVIALEKSPPVASAKRSRRAELELRQINVCPPTFLITTNVPGTLPSFYQRFLERKLRQKFDFQGTPVKIIYKKFTGRK